MTFPEILRENKFSITKENIIISGELPFANFLKIRDFAKLSFVKL